MLHLQNYLVKWLLFIFITIMIHVSKYRCFFISCYCFQGLLIFLSMYAFHVKLCLRDIKMQKKFVDRHLNLRIKVLSIAEYLSFCTRDTKCESTYSKQKQLHNSNLKFFKRSSNSSMHNNFVNNRKFYFI